MLPKRMHISQAATDKLKILKGRTSLTPNIVCRIALVRSLRDGPRAGKQKVDQNGSEFIGTTLFGEYANVFEALIVQVHGPMDMKTMGQVIASHIDDGLTGLMKARTVAELVAYAT
ncbi:DNA sulfur modification protein DndE [Acidovorax sp. JMULE5]|uniref:DNA sulfur modification protein DndE n=1 Tax=Acidovorax sp. JMULE5 TaxID=2518343 RepID=UPI0015A46251|nr:DNA sulfur modification protein DndE [Acidovorax sp. JMULE5]QLA82557.1 DNA sulfur modification protein DndE [Acidovorax sp. JMULE5]